MDVEHVCQITRERIAASQEQAVRDLVRTNAMLADEVEMLRDQVRRLQAIVHGQNPECPCQGYMWWNDWGLADPGTKSHAGRPGAAYRAHLRPGI
jgi:hypothetical protein